MFDPSRTADPDRTESANRLAGSEVPDPVRAFGFDHHPSAIRPARPIQTAPVDRLAELVHHLGGVPLGEARRVVHRVAPGRAGEDPLSVVAAALVRLRRDARHRLCVGV